MQNSKIEFKINNTRNKEVKVDLFKVSNIFGVGIEQNRRKNDGADSFIIFDDIISKTLPTQHIVKKRIEPKELARIFMQVHLNIESKISMELIDKKTSETKGD